jgi:hypothetical protein
VLEATEVEASRSFARGKQKEQSVLEVNKASFDFSCVLDFGVKYPCVSF